MNGGRSSMKRRWKRRWASVLVVVGVLIGVLPNAAVAQRGRAELNDGNRLYEEGRFPEAHEKYLEALRDAPDLPVALFNDGNALYQSEEYVRALDAYRGAIEAGDPALAAPASYNLGNDCFVITQPACNTSFNVSIPFIAILQMSRVSAKAWLVSLTRATMAHSLIR